ncbi:MAG: dioxygenase [Saccharospirillaceae bacterium]|nr:dioxygenase [Saccharospirillaceae bacterium]
MPVVYIPHGGGPMPLLGDDQHKELIAFLANLHKDIKNSAAQPTAILIISAHWEENEVTLTSSDSPSMIYDYGGFPQETYEYQYPAAGHPKLANQVMALLKSNGINSKLDATRGFDHGTFVPLMLMYPKAQIPVVQMSLLRSLDPAQHIKIGEVLSTLRQQGVLIVGSGMSFHNFSGSKQNSIIFDDWLTNTMTNNDLEKTKQDLINWAEAPSGRESHAREEHLLPLHVCFGVVYNNQQPAEKIFDSFLYDKKISAFIWY